MIQFNYCLKSYSCNLIFIIAVNENVPESPVSSKADQSKHYCYGRATARSAQRNNSRNSNKSRNSELEAICEKTPT